MATEFTPRVTILVDDPGKNKLAGFLPVLSAISRASCDQSQQPFDRSLDFRLCCPRL